MAGEIIVAHISAINGAAREGMRLLKAQEEETFFNGIKIMISTKYLLALNSRHMAFLLQARRREVFLGTLWSRTNYV